MYNGDTRAHCKRRNAERGSDETHLCSDGPAGSALLRLAYGSPRPITLDLSGALRARQPLTVDDIGSLAAGGRQAFVLRVPQRESLELRVPFSEAPFNGTQLNAQINGRRLLPYFAFGGDTRYDAVKGKPGMRPPMATIEGRWVIPAGWLRKGNNELILWTTGVQQDAALERLGPKPAIRIDGVTVGPLDGARSARVCQLRLLRLQRLGAGLPVGESRTG